MGVDLEAAPGVFVVREETEILGNAAVRALTEQSGEVRVLDMGCGSGNLSCAIAVHVPKARVWASDLLEACAALTRRNVARHGLEARVTVSRGDLFAPLAGLELEGTIDAVVMNPPYIATVRLDKDRAELLKDEPREAFDGGPYGISMVQRLIKESAPFLKPGGALLFEFGVGQERQIKALVGRARLYDPVVFEHNLAGEARAVVARKKQG
jgi:release factor glutamine methyltransferase